jgi:hypothetical protein
MKCPNCQHETATGVLVKCTACGQAYERTLLEEYEHLRFTIKWLEDQRAQVGEPAGILLDELLSRRQELLERMHPAPSLDAGAQSAPAVPAVPAPVALPAQASIAPHPVVTVALPAKASVAPQPVVSATVPAVPLKKIRPETAPKPAKPPRDWGKVWNQAIKFVVSGALLRALLYLGAFMIVVSAMVLVVRFWDIFPPVLQVGFIFALPSVFYLAGWLIRAKLKLQQAGIVITGVGELLVGVAFAGLYQLGNLRMGISQYWLMASALCTLIYVLTALLLEGEFFDSLALIGGGSTLVALTRTLALPLEWTLAMLTLYGLGLTELSVLLESRPKWKDSYRVARVLAEIITPLSLAAVCFTAIPPRLPGQTVTALLSAGVYGLLAWKFPAHRHIHLLLVSLALGVGFGAFIIVTNKGSWLAAELALLSGALIFVAWRFFKAGNAFKLNDYYRRMLFIYGAGLGLISLLLAGIDFAAHLARAQSAVPLTILALSLVAWHFLFRKPMYGYLGAILFLAPFYVWLELLHLNRDFYPLAFLLLVLLVYIPAGMRTSRQENKFARPFYFTGYGVSAILLALAAFWNPQAQPWMAPTLLAGLFALYVFSAWYFKNSVFVWGAALALPLAAQHLLVNGHVTIVASGLVWSGLAFAYLLAERWLARQRHVIFTRRLDRLPLVLGSVALALVGLGVSLYAYFIGGMAALSLLNLAVLCFLCIAMARAYHSRLPLLALPPVACLLGILFFNSYARQIFGHDFRTGEFSLVAGAIGLAHFLAAALLDRLKTRYSHALYAGAYALTGLQVITAASDRPFLASALGLFLLGMGASAALVVAHCHQTWDDFTGLFGHPGSRTGQIVRSIFLWPVAWLLPIWLMLLLEKLPVWPGYSGLAFSLSALAYLLCLRWLKKPGAEFGWPFLAAAHVYAAGALLVNYNYLPFNLRFTLLRVPLWPLKTTELHLEIGQALVQAVTVVFYAVWAAQKKQRIFAHLAAWLSIAAFTSLLFILNFLRPPAYATAWMAWAVVLLLVGYLLDHIPSLKARLAHGPTLAGMVLAGLALAFSTGDRLENLATLGLCILVALASFIALHYKQQRSFEDFIGFFLRSESLIKRAARLFYLFFAAYTFPVWLMQLMAQGNLGMAYRGGALALLAPVYIALGLWLRRKNPDYSWPLYSAGYAFTALGAMLVSADTRMMITILLLDVAVYAVSAIIFNSPAWLYLATFLLPVPLLLVLSDRGLLNARSSAWCFMGLAYLYFARGLMLERKRKPGEAVERFALPFFAPAYLFNAAALALASGEQKLALVIYPLGILIYGFSAWRFREPLYVYPATWLAIIPYYLFIINYTSLPARWLGLAWLPLILVYIGLGRFAFGHRRLDMRSPGGIFRSLKTYQAPFYFVAYALSVNMLLTSRLDPSVMTVACAAGTLLYLGSALLFRHPAWLYPTLLVAHLTILSFFSIDPSGAPPRTITLPFLALTWLEALAGVLVSRAFPVTEPGPGGSLTFRFFNRRFNFGVFPSLGHLSVPSWAQPIFIVVLVDTLAWESLALTGLDTGLWVSLGFMLLFALLASLWQDRLTAYLSQVFAALALACQLRSMGFSAMQTFAWLTGLAFGLYLLSWLLSLVSRLRESIWPGALQHGALALSIICALASLPTVIADPIPTATALGFAGILYLSLSLQNRAHLLGYLGMGLILVGWSMFLFVKNSPQPQFYALPAGLYFSVVGLLERRRRPGLFALLIESLGLSVMLTTSFVQSLNTEGGFPYFLLLLVESLLVIWWGAAWRLRVPFLTGLGASVLNVLAQVVVLVFVYEVNRWIIIFGVGILLVGVGLFVERRRENLVVQAQGLRDMLERWS